MKSVNTDPPLCLYCLFSFLTGVTPLATTVATGSTTSSLITSVSSSLFWQPHEHLCSTGAGVNIANATIAYDRIADAKAKIKDEGKEEKLISQICRKLRRGKSVTQIADELEEDEIRVQSICDTAAEFAPDYDEDKVIKAVLNPVED